MIVNIVSFSLLGRTHTIKTQESSEIINEAATMVDEKLKFLASCRGVEPSDSLGLLAALELAGELCKLRKDYQRLMTLAEKDGE